MKILHSGMLKFISAVAIGHGMLIVHSSSHAQTASVNAATVYQTMDGFGGQTWTYGDNITGSNASLFFSPSTGIGLQYIRTANTWDGGVPDLASLKAAVALGAQVELSFQSPPCSLKHSYVDESESCSQTGDSGIQPAAFNDGGVSSNGTCFTSSQALSASFAAYATYMVNYINTLQNAPNNIPVAVIDVQNEPDISSSSLGACIWGNGGNFDTFVGSYLGPALSSAGLHPKVMLGSAAIWFGDDYSSACLNDATCSQYVNFAAGHGYPYPLSPSPYTLGTSSGRHLWLSETSDSSAWDTSMVSALTMATNIHSFLTVANVSAYEWWELAYDSSSGNFGLTDSSFNPTKRFYALGNWSKFVRQGWSRISATANPQSGVYVTAFENQSSGAFAIVAVNTNQTSVSQAFSLSGLTSSSVTPNITDPNNNLASQSSLSVSANSFTATLTGSSVTTFAGSGTVSTGSGTASGIPTNLTGALVQ
jgi:O-glycosyl hydrolase